ncbi:MAG TPA: EamA family transporter RarD [Micromonosporaceae bacterium]|jgi:chloramphenicol-sensitive protein RarD
MSTSRAGYVSGLVAYLCWGLFPLYWRLLRPSTPLEILAHRIVWSLVFVLVLIAVSRSWRRLRGLLRARTIGRIAVAATLIAINWGTYIYGVNADRVVETSLGYFINPLVTVLLGVIVLRERLSVPQWVAIGIGALAVGVLTVDYGQLPVLALVLAASFGLYGLIKKRLAVPATEGLAIESGLLTLPASAYLVVMASTGDSTFGHVSAAHTALLVASGVVTGIPLIAFAAAANRIPLSAIGLLQYIAPILQLGCGVLILGEPMPAARLAGFGLVWVALAVFTWDGIRRLRSTTRTPVVAAPTISAADSVIAS